MEKYVQLAKNAALSSEGVGRNDNYRLGAVLLNSRGRILSCRSNSRKTHPLALKFSRYPFLHAEAHAITSAGLDNCKGGMLLVVRTRADNSLTMARPCSSCQALINYVGIKDVLYSDWSGQIQRSCF